MVISTIAGILSTLAPSAPTTGTPIRTIGKRPPPRLPIVTPPVVRFGGSNPNPRVTLAPVASPSVIAAKLPPGLQAAQVAPVRDVNAYGPMVIRPASGAPPVGGASFPLANTAPSSSRDASGEDPVYIEPEVPSFPGLPPPEGPRYAPPKLQNASGSEIKASVEVPTWLAVTGVVGLLGLSALALTYALKDSPRVRKGGRR